MDKSTTHNLSLALEKVTQTLFQMGQVVSEYPENGDTLLQDQISQLVSDLNQVQAGCSSKANVKIPVDILKFMDDGKDPVDYLAESVQLAHDKNQAMKGKLEALKKFKDLLEKKLPLEVEH